MPAQGGQNLSTALQVRTNQRAVFGSSHTPWTNRPMTAADGKGPFHSPPGKQPIREHGI